MNEEQGTSSRLSESFELFVLSILTAILALQVMVALRLEFIWSLADFSMRTGFVMWMILFGSYVSTRVSRIETLDTPRTLWFIELVCLILLMTSLAGMFVPRFKTAALWSNVIVVLLCILSVIGASMNRPAKRKYIRYK